MLHRTTNRIISSLFPTNIVFIWNSQPQNSYHKIPGDQCEGGFSPPASKWVDLKTQCKGVTGSYFFKGLKNQREGEVPVVVDVVGVDIGVFVGDFDVGVDIGIFVCDFDVAGGVNVALLLLLLLIFSLDPSACKNVIREIVI